MDDQIAILSRKGDCLSIRLPKEIGLINKDFELRVEGNEIILSFKKVKSWREFFEETALPSADFMKERKDLSPQIRDQF